MYSEDRVDIVESLVMRYSTGERQNNSLLVYVKKTLHRDQRNSYRNNGRFIDNSYP